MSKEITVAITCFNYGAFLEASVQSALQQRPDPPNVIVVDDGSTDPHTLKQLERLPPEVTLLRLHNGGVAKARNAALALARTPYLLTLDADDQLTPGALATMRTELETYPELGFSYGLMRFCGDWEGTVRMPPYDPYRLLYRHSIGATALMRRELFADVGGYDPEFRGYEDWDFWLGALARGWHGRQLQQVTLLYRRHGPAMRQDARAHYRSTFRQLRRKHAGLYSHAGRRRLAVESALGVSARLAYRWWWGARPLPARLELALQAYLWRRA
jgi:glycosyltransferase involved in cell wall biosynthesis